MLRLFVTYRKLNPALYRIFLGGFLINLINVAFMMIFNIYLRKLGYEDEYIGHLTSLRYLGVFIASLPLGALIKTRRLKPFFAFAALATPVFSLLVLEAVRYGWANWAMAFMLLWGCGFVVVRVCTLPFILRHTPKPHQPEAIALNHAIWSASMLVAGLMIALLSLDSFATWLLSFDAQFSELNLLRLFSIMGLLALLLYLTANEQAPPARRPTGAQAPAAASYRGYDWGKIVKALLPTTFMALGAGLTVPFMNLYFYQVFQFDSDQFSLMAGLASVLVVGGVVIIPRIQKNYGYPAAIITTQTTATVLLLGLALTQLIATWEFAVWLAVIFYLGRRPLMNVAAPMNYDLKMQFVGERNHEMVSGINSSIWSSAWFLSGQLFKWMRSLDMAYYQILLTTVGLYTIGIIAYALLIRANNQRLAAERMPAKAAAEVPKG